MLSWANGNGVVFVLDDDVVCVALLSMWCDVGSLLKLSFSVYGKGSVVASTCGVLVNNFGISSFMFGWGIFPAIASIFSSAFGC